MKNKAAKRNVLILTIIVSIGFLAYYYQNYFASPRKMPLDSVPIGIETILMFSFVGIFFYQEMNDTESLFIYNKPHFWGVIGIMIYLALSFFVYIFANQISIKELGKFWIITNIACIIRNIFFCRQLFLQSHINDKKKVLFKLSPAH